MKRNNFDILIIGGGPSGIWASYYAALRGLTVCLVEKNDGLGGLPKFNYPTKPINDIPGLIEITGSDLVDNLLSQLDRQKDSIDICLNSEVTKITRKEAFEIEMVNNSKKKRFSAKTILFTQGVGSLNSRKVDFKVSQSKLVYKIEDINSFKGIDVLISGGGDSALENAIFIAKANKSNSIYLCHRRDEFRGKESILKKASKLTNLSLLTPYVIENILEDDRLNVSLTNVSTKTIKNIVVDKVLVQHGYNIEKISLDNTGLSLKKVTSQANSKYLTNSNYETSENGVYMVGITASSFNQNLINTSFGAVSITICDLVKKYFDNRTRNY